MRVTNFIWNDLVTTMRSNALKRAFNVFVLLTCLPICVTTADDWPGWRGKDRSDISTETNLLATWPAGGPTKLWMYENAGVGYSGFSVVNNRLFTMGTRDNETILLCLDASTGAELWHQPMGEILENGWGNGPRSTPTVDGKYVYALSGPGVLMCAQVDSGKVVWQRSMEEFGGICPKWGYSESVLVDGERVVCTPGGNIGMAIALNRETGELIWQTESLSGQSHYSSFIKAEHQGKPQYIQLARKFAFGVEPTSGEVLWESDWDGKVAVIPTPIYNEGKVYVTSGYGVGCKLISLTGDQATEIYKNKVMKNHHGGVVRVGDFLYGYSDGTGWICQSFESGEMIWNEKDVLDKGAISVANNMLYCIGEDSGEVVLAKASPNGWQESGRFTLTPQTQIRKARGRIWTHPVISGGKLYLRDQDLIFCFDISAN